MRFFVYPTLCCFLVASADAATLDIDVEINIDSYYDYRSASQKSFSFNGIVSVRMYLGALKTTDYGTTTISYGQSGSAFFSSPLTSEVGVDPYGSGLQNVYAYTFQNTSDYASVFIEELAAQSNAYSSQYLKNGTGYWAYHAELRVDQRTSSKSGTGASDYAMDLADALRLLSEWHNGRATAYFNESWQLYDIVSGDVVYAAGASWSDYNAKLVSASLDGQAIDLDTIAIAPVPLPASAPLLLGGFVLASLLFRRRQV